MDNYLVHHGIAGQKWGKTNGPPYPLNYESHSSEQKKRNPKSTIDNYDYGSNKSSNSVGKSKSKTLNKKSTTKKQDVTPVKNRAKQKKLSKKSGMFDRMEKRYYDQYINEGMSSKDAKEMAAKRVKRDKIIMAGAAITLAAAIAYTAHRTSVIDKAVSLNSGELLQRIDIKDAELHDKFYASFGKDNSLYKGLMPGFYKNNAMYGKDSQTFVLEACKDIKAPNRSEAVSVFKDWVLNDDNAGTLYSKYSRDVIEKANGKALDALYDQFNQQLVDYNKTELVDGFYNRLKEKGYNALVDTSDQKFGFRSDHPLILFDKSAVTVRDITANKYDQNEYALNQYKMFAHATIDSILRSDTTKVAAVGTGAAYCAKYGINESKVKKDKK